MGTEAFGRPGLVPRWTSSTKEGIGTAYHTASRVWFTLSHGIVNEVYFPTVDQPQVRDLEYLVTDGETFFHEEKRDLDTEIEYLNDHALGYRITNSDPQGRYRIVKEIIADPHFSSILIQTRMEGDDDFLKKLRLYVLLAPHLEGRGWGNKAKKTEVVGRTILIAHRKVFHLAMAATVPFSRASCGFVGSSDGWTDLHEDFKIDWEFDHATDGNVALTGELDLSRTRTFTLGLAFGIGQHAAVTTLLQSLAVPFDQARERFLKQWERACAHVADHGQASASGDGGRLFRTSTSLLLAHEDKTFAGAVIASMSIPWGEVLGDDDGLGGYHLVWTRDMCNSALALLAAGKTETPYRALVFLMASQRADGGFAQNFWIKGHAYWTGIQLDETAFPIMLAWRLQEQGLLQDSPYPMILKAARYLVDHGPATPQERWEENSGYSPSTLAAVIAGLVCAAQFARLERDVQTAKYLEDYADFLESHLDGWTVTTQGTLVPGIRRHYIRILPVNLSDPQPPEDPNIGILQIRNRPPGEPFEFPAKEIVDAGFLELVRYGIRRANDPLVEDSLKVVDAVLKVDTPLGPCWRRYNHDGYGQRADGSPYQGWGVGRAWPLLTGERGHYELSAGRDVKPFIRAMEGFASKAGMLPEQIWDESICANPRMCLGRPTGAAMPLMWAHAEYIKLLRSTADGVTFDRIDAVAQRYLGGHSRKDLEIWKLNRQPKTVSPGTTLRIQTTVPFRLHWSLDEWLSANETPAESTPLGIHYVDIAIPTGQRAPVRFSFRESEGMGTNGRDYAVEMASQAVLVMA